MMFMAHALNIDLTVAQQIQLLLLCMLTSKGAAGVVGSSMVVLVSTLQTANMIPVAAVTLIMGVDRFMSECRALVNFLGNTVATIFVAKVQGQFDSTKLNAALASAPAQSIEYEKDAWDDEKSLITNNI